MGRIRRGGYFFEWWVGDHPPRHIHVSDSAGRLLGRIRLDTMESIDPWQPPRKVRQIIEDIEKGGRL